MVASVLWHLPLTQEERYKPEIIGFKSILTNLYRLTGESFGYFICSDS